MILYLAADLIWASKIKGAADAAGLAARPVRTLEMLEARLADSNPNAVLLDLECPQVALQIVGRLRGESAGERERSIQVVCFGPHIAKELFQQAHQAGADEVMARGALDRTMGDVLLRLSKPGRLPEMRPFRGPTPS